MKKVLAILILLTLLMGACARPGMQQTANAGGAQVNRGTSLPPIRTPDTRSDTVVHMGMMTFIPSAVTISTGSRITLMNDSDVFHIIANGKWQKTTPQPGAEAGAPTIPNIQFSTASQSQTIGPFMTAGTFSVYCSVHPAMNLIVTVQ